MVLVGGVLEGLNYICMYVIHGGGDGRGWGTEGEGRGGRKRGGRRGGKEGGGDYSPPLLYVFFHTCKEVTGENSCT